MLPSLAFACLRLLARLAAVFYASLFVFEWLVFLVSPPLFVAFTVCVALPLVALYMWWRSVQKECTLSSVVHAVGRGFFDVGYSLPSEDISYYTHKNWGKTNNLEIETNDSLGSYGHTVSID